MGISYSVGATYIERRLRSPNPVASGVLAPALPRCSFVIFLMTQSHIFLWFFVVQLPPDERRVHLPAGLGGTVVQRDVRSRFLRPGLPGALSVRERGGVRRRHGGMPVCPRVYGEG